MWEVWQGEQRRITTCDTFDEAKRVWESWTRKGWMDMRVRLVPVEPPP